MLLVSQTDGAIKVSGALDLGAAEELRCALAVAIGLGGSVALDLSEAVACDTACLQLLYSAQRAALAARADFGITACSPAVARAALAVGLRIEDLVDGRKNASGV